LFRRTDFVDTTPPAITCPANITLACNLDPLVPVFFSAIATDNCDSSPTVTCSPPSGSGFAVGTTTVNCMATDASGNQSSCSFTVTRAPLGFVGFSSPLGGADTTGGSFDTPLETFKLGSVIPIRFVASCSGTAVETGVHTLQAIKYSDSTTSDAPVDASAPDAATTGNQFELKGVEWQFNLGTKQSGMSVGRWLLRASLSDGSQHSAWIQLK
jgi:hypothetical protein